MIDVNVNSFDIEISRGDCASFCIEFTGEDVPNDGEPVVFTVKKTENYETPLIKKELFVKDGEIYIDFYNLDTQNLPFGDYVWDIRFPDLLGTGEPFTPMKPAKFTIAKVVGNG